MSAAQLDTLRNENDWDTITVGGETLNVEKSVITLNVNTFFDENDGSATIGAGRSLRDAIIIANNDPTNDYIINLGSGQTYFLTLGLADENNGLEGDLDIQNGANITIRTNGASPATINASTLLGDGDRVFDVLSGGALTLEKVIVTGGRTRGFVSGAGISNSGALNIFQSTITNNTTGNNANGGGIYNIGNATIVQSTINDNFASSGGGGISNEGDLTITHSTISGNCGISFRF